MAETAKNEWEEREIGALWVKEGKGSGQEFFTGEIKVGETTQKVVIYLNKFKEAGDNKPKYRVYKDREQSDFPA